MKKVFAVLAIAVLLVGAVFAADGATETHTIKLKTNVGYTYPVFQLAYKSGTNVKADQAAVVTNNAAHGEAPNQTFGDEYDPDTPATYGATAQSSTGYEVEVLDISKNDITVVFSVKLNNEAKLVRNFELKFTAGAFNVKKAGGDATVAAAEAKFDPASGMATALLGVEDNQSTDGVAKLKFNGTTCAPGEIGTYTVKYNQDPAVNPNVDEDHYYYADIKMEVVAK